MGYYTNYELEVSNAKNILDILKEMDSQKESDKFYPFQWKISKKLQESDNFELSDYLNIEGDEESKWYKHETEMKELSTYFPEVLFKLHGEGEENGDIWDKYFKNGKMQVRKAVMTIPPYDESKLE